MTERDWQKDWEMYQYYKKYLDDNFINFILNESCDIDTDQNVLIEEFLAETRQALPYWLQRVRELQNDRNLEKQMRKDAEDRCTELEERVQKLDLVAELAQKFLAAIDLAQRTGAPLTMPPVQWEALYKLRDAVANLEGEW